MSSLSFITEMLILENRIEFLKQNLEGKLSTEHDTNATAKTTSEIVDHFANNADPTPNKAHTQWILKQYQNKSIRQEDAPRVHQALTNFNQVKSKLDKKDINQYQDVSEIETAVHPHLKAAGPKKTKGAGFDRRNPEAYGDDHIKKVFEDKESGVKGYHLKTKAASISLYGGGHTAGNGGTSWCTAADSSGNMFNHYNGAGAKKIHTMHFPNGRKLQFHHDTNQIMDEADKTVNLKDPGYAPYEKHIRQFVSETAGKKMSNIKISHGNVTDEEVDQHIASNPDSAARSLPLKDHHFAQLTAPVKNTRRWESTDPETVPSHHWDNLASNQNLTEQQSRAVAEHHGTSGGYYAGTRLADMARHAPKNVAMDILKNHSQGPQSFHNFISRPDVNDHERIQALEHAERRGHLTADLSDELAKKITDPELINKMVETPGNHQHLLHNPNLTAEHLHTIHDKSNLVNSIHPNNDSGMIQKILTTNAKNVSYSDKYASAVTSKAAGPEHIDAIKHAISLHAPAAQKHIVSGVVDNENFTPTHIMTHFSQHLDNSAKVKLLKKHTLSPEHREDLHKSVVDSTYAGSYAQSGRLTAQHAHDLIDRGHHEVFENTKAKIDSSHIDKAVNGHNILMIKAALNHPSAQASHFQKVLDTKPHLHGLLAGHQKTPTNMLQTLSSHEDPNFAAMAKNQLKKAK